MLTADVEITSIRPNATQPRVEFNIDAINELAASIKIKGIIQPVIIRTIKSDDLNEKIKYEIIAGERRWRAAQIAGLSTIPAVIKQSVDDRETLMLSLIENIQRNDLNPIEEALAYQRLAKIFSLTHDQISEGVGKSRSSVSNLLRILELPNSVQDAIKAGRLSIGHAKVLLMIPDPKVQAQFATKAQVENMTVRQLERLITGAISTDNSASKTSNSNLNANVAKQQLSSANNLDIERKLREHFGTRVSIEENLRKGRIIIEFYSPDDFERVTKLMGVNS